MRLEIIYVEKYDHTVDSYGASSRRTETSDTLCVPWDGEANPAEVVRAHAQDFLTREHPTTTPHSWGESGHRVEVVGVRIGGAHGLVFPLANRVVIKAQEAVKAE